MVVVRFRTEENAKELLRKLKKMHKFTRELIECVETKHEEDDEFDDESYREEDDYESMNERAVRPIRRYRRSM